MPQGKLVLNQKFQVVTGTLTSGNVVTPVKGRLNGTDISLTAGAAQFSGQVNGSAIEGTTKRGDKSEPWKATRGKGQPGYVGPVPQPGCQRRCTFPRRKRSRWRACTWPMSTSFG